MTGDSLTVLHSTSGKRASKEFTRIVDKKTGEVKIRNKSYGNEGRFRVEIIPVTCFADLAAALNRLIHLIYAFLIRGVPAAGINLNHTPRWKRPHHGLPATFAEAPHHWFLLDLDHLTAPPLTDVVNDPEAAIEHVIGLLSPQFHDATCWYTFTSSQGLPKSDPTAPDTLSVRLAFWSEVPLSDAELKRWAAAINKAAGYKLVDPVLFDAIQAHYIAAPSFIGMADPLPRRHGVRHGLEETISLVIPPADAKHPDIVGSEGYPVGRGTAFYLEQIGEPHFREPIKSAIASFIAINGAKADCEGLKREIRRAIQAANAGGRDQDTLSRYASDEHLDGLIAAIRAFQRDKPGKGFIPEPPEHVIDPDIPDDEFVTPPLPELDLEQAIAANDVEAAITALNKRYAVVNEGGKAVVFEPVIDPLRKRRVLVRISFDNLRKLYQNRKITVVAAGEPVTRSVAAWWLDSPFRRQFLDGVVFDPTNTVPASYWNLWSGFAVEPAPGDWSLMQDHVLQVICRGVREHYEYLLNTAARMFQRPNTPGEVCVVIRGKEGSGKGTFLLWLFRAWGQHGMHITSAKHLTGNFNAHLRDCVMLFADEAFFADDRQHEGILKGLITEDTIAIEPKHYDIIEVPSALHIWMSSNHDWVVPASLEARRFFVLDAADNRIGQWEYFAAIHRQMEAGGLAAMIHDLLKRDISGFNVRAIPQTAALKVQQTLSLSSLEQWWLAALSRGFLWKSRHGAPWFSAWHEFYTTELLVRSYQQWCDEARASERKGRPQLGTFFTQLYRCSRPRGQHPGYEIDSIDRSTLRDTFDASGNIISSGLTLDEIAIVFLDHPNGYQIGELEDARARFLEICDVNPGWGDE
jgi:hypothetical protein